jgi:cytoskeleton protein RodZ
MTVSQSHAAGLRAEDDYASDGPRQTHCIDLSMIGPLLRQAREDQGLTLPAVAESLLVRKGHLSAIECACWDTLPHDVYVKGYVKAYASYLHVEDKLEHCLGKLCACADAKNGDVGAHAAARSEESSTGTGSAGRLHLSSTAVVGLSSICVAVMVALVFFAIRQPGPVISLFDVFSAYNGAVTDIKKDVTATLAVRPEVKPEAKPEVKPEEVKPAAVPMPAVAPVSVATPVSAVAPMPVVRVIPAAKPAVRQEEPVSASTDAQEDEVPEQTGTYKASAQDDDASTR